MIGILVSLFISAGGKDGRQRRFPYLILSSETENPSSRRLFHFNRLNLCFSIDAHFNIQEMNRETHTDKDRRHSLLLLSIHSSPVLEDEI